MIEARLDHDFLAKCQNNILHSIVTIQALKDAGVPIFGHILMHGPARGVLTQHSEEDLDQNEWVMRWFDDDEPMIGPKEQPTQPVEATGILQFGRWTRYRNPKKPRPVEDDEL